MHVEISSFVKNTWKLLSMKDEKSNTLRVRSVGSSFCSQKTKGRQLEADENLFK